jgi:hypothetical protein
MRVSARHPEEFEAITVKRILASQVADAMGHKGLPLDRLLHPDNASVVLRTLQLPVQWPHANRPPSRRNQMNLRSSTRTEDIFADLLVANNQYQSRQVRYGSQNAMQS